MLEVFWQLHTMGGRCKVVELGVGGLVINRATPFCLHNALISNCCIFGCIFAGVSWSFKQLNVKEISIFRSLIALTTNSKDNLCFLLGNVYIV